MTRYEIFEYVNEQYGTQPEYLWEKTPDAAVLRNIANAKWYAIVMNVSKKSLGLNGEGKVDIINVKCDPLIVGSLRIQKGFLPAYHMNKDNWISIILDGGASDSLILELLDASYDAVAGR